MFESSFPVQNVKVTLPTSLVIPIAQIGFIVLSKDVRLLNVLFVPNFKYNLLQVSASTYHLPYSLVFTHDAWVIQEYITRQDDWEGLKKREALSARV